MPGIAVRLADLDDTRDAHAVVEMTRAYAKDPMGKGDDLPEVVKRDLVGEMRDHPGVFCLLAWDEESPVGIATCVLSFSTFRARKLVNVHDLAVIPEARGKGVSRMLLEAVEGRARQDGCAGITLEVSCKNHHARNVYSSMGFKGAHSEGEDATYFCFKELSYDQ